MLTKIKTDIHFIVAKVRAMRSALYEGDLLSGLLRHRTLSELAQQLCPQEAFASHTALERRLVERYAESLALLWRYLDERRGRLFATLAVRLQIENLKVVLRGQLSGRTIPPEALPVIPLPEVFRWTDFDPSRLGNVHEILDAIPEAALRQSAGEALVLFTETPIPLYLEAGLDRGYLRLLVEAVKPLAGEDRAEVEPLLRLEIDMHNLMFVLRARVNHRFEPGVVADLAAAGTAGAKPAPWVAQAAEGQTVREIVAQAPRGLRRALTDVPAELPDIERRLWQRYYGMASRLYYQSFFSIGCPYAFAAIKRMELANLITVVEAVRYGLPIEETLNRLLQPMA